MVRRERERVKKGMTRWREGKRDHRRGEVEWESWSESQERKREDL